MQSCLTKARGMRRGEWEQFAIAIASWRRSLGQSKEQLFGQVSTIDHHQGLIENGTGLMNGPCHEFFPVPLSVWIKTGFVEAAVRWIRR